MAAQFQALVSQAPSYVVNFRVSWLPVDNDAFERVSRAGSTFEQSSTSGRILRSASLRVLPGPQGLMLYADVHRISRPNDLNEATQRISHNVRGFRRGGPPFADVQHADPTLFRQLQHAHGCSRRLRFVFHSKTRGSGSELERTALLTNPLLLIALGFLTGGFIAINKFAPEPTQVGEHVVTKKGLYTGLVRLAAFERVFSP
jgi:hypothetical protein